MDITQDQSTTEDRSASQGSDAFDAPTTHAEDLPNLRIDNRRNTCRYWALGDCVHGEHCDYAHHLFPITVYRSAEGGHKSKPCRFGDKCRWPPDICGFGHGEDKVARKLTDSFAKDWTVVMSYVCNKCGARFDKLEKILEHRRSHGLQAPDPAAPIPSVVNSVDRSRDQRSSSFPNKPQDSNKRDWDTFGRLRREVRSSEANADETSQAKQEHRKSKGGDKGQ